MKLYWKRESLIYENICKSKKNFSEFDSYYVIFFINIWLCINGGGDVNWGRSIRKESGRISINRSERRKNRKWSGF